MRRAALLLAILLPGCLGGAPDAGDPSAAPTAQPDEAPRTADGVFEAEAPDLPTGRAWTYRARQLYDPDEEFTVVVAQKGPDGYLFAGGAEDDLVYEALWGSEWHGPHGLDLNEPQSEWKGFDFPLRDGKTWSPREGIEVTAREADVRLPGGATERGFVVEGGNERVRLRYEYAPSVGYYVRLSFTIEDAPHEELELARVADNASWVWFERGPVAVASNPHEPGVAEVPDGWDAVIVSAGGAGGGRVRVAAPPGAPQPAWEASFEGEEAWVHGAFPATPGRWAAAVQGHPFVEALQDAPRPSGVGWAYAHLAPVRWTRG